jgi:hypothetical protein
MGQMAQNRTSVGQGASNHALQQPTPGVNSVKQAPASVEKQQMEMLHE